MSNHCMFNKVFNSIIFSRFWFLQPIPPVFKMVRRSHPQMYSFSYNREFIIRVPRSPGGRQKMNSSVCIYHRTHTHPLLSLKFMFLDWETKLEPNPQASGFHAAVLRYLHHCTVPGSRDVVLRVRVNRFLSLSSQFIFKSGVILVLLSRFLL